MNKYNVRTITILATVIFISSFMLFPGSPLQSSSYSTVYAAAPIKCQEGISCIGTTGDDNMHGLPTGDQMIGLEGDDRMSGGDGNDGMQGFDGNDKLSGGKGDDQMTGGSGSDSFKCGAGTDLIADFSAAQGDTKSNDCENF